MTAVEYRQTPNRVQLRPIPAALRLGNEAGTVARRRDLSGDPVFWAIRFLSRPRRSAMYALYWFWREIETIARDETSDLLKEALLSDWRSEIALLYDGRPRREVTRSLVEPVRLYGLKCDDFLTIVNGLGTGTRGAAQAPSLAADLGRPTTAHRDASTLIDRQCHSRRVGKRVVLRQTSDHTIDRLGRFFIFQSVEPPLYGTHEELAARHTQLTCRTLHPIERFIRQGNRRLHNRSITWLYHRS